MGWMGMVVVALAIGVFVATRPASYSYTADFPINVPAEEAFNYIKTGDFVQFMPYKSIETTVVNKKDPETKQQYLEITATANLPVIGDLATSASFKPNRKTLSFSAQSIEVSFDMFQVDANMTLKPQGASSCSAHCEVTIEGYMLPAFLMQKEHEKISHIIFDGIKNELEK